MRRSTPGGRRGPAPARLALLATLVLVAPVHAMPRTRVATLRACRAACAATIQACAFSRVDPPARNDWRQCRVTFTYLCRFYYGTDWCETWWADHPSGTEGAAVQN